MDRRSESSITPQDMVFIAWIEAACLAMKPSKRVKHLRRVEAILAAAAERPQSLKHPDHKEKATEALSLLHRVLPRLLA